MAFGSLSCGFCDYFECSVTDIVFKSFEYFGGEVSLALFCTCFKWLLMIRSLVLSSVISVLMSLFSFTMFTFFSMFSWPFSWPFSCPSGDEKCY